MPQFFLQLLSLGTITYKGKKAIKPLFNKKLIVFLCTAVDLCK